jgi:hypothetical protein
MKLRKAALVITTILIANGAAFASEDPVAETASETVFAQDNPTGKTFTGEGRARKKDNAQKEAEDQADKKAEKACRAYCQSQNQSLWSVDYEDKKGEECIRDNKDNFKCRVEKTVKQCNCRDEPDEDAIAEFFTPGEEFTCE